MPNRVFYTDDNTPYKVMGALTGDGEMDLKDALNSIKRLNASGLVVVEYAKAGSTAPAASDTE